MPCFVGSSRSPSRNTVITRRGLFGLLRGGPVPAPEPESPEVRPNRDGKPPVRVIPVHRPPRGGGRKRFSSSIAPAVVIACGPVHIRPFPWLPVDIGRLPALPLWFPTPLPASFARTSPASVPVLPVCCAWIVLRRWLPPVLKLWIVWPGNVPFAAFARNAARFPVPWSAARENPKSRSPIAWAVAFV
jgi:hypothetical protein